MVNNEMADNSTQQALENILGIGRPPLAKRMFRLVQNSESRAQSMVT